MINVALIDNNMIINGQTNYFRGGTGSFTVIYWRYIDKLIVLKDARSYVHNGYMSFNCECYITYGDDM